MQIPSFQLPASSFPPTMESRSFSALLSSLVSDLLVFLLFSFPLSTTTNHHDAIKSNTPLFLHLLTSFHLLASISSSPSSTPSKKRKRHPIKGKSPSPSPSSSSSSSSSTMVLLPNPASFKSHFLMTSTTFEWLSGLLEPLLDCRDPAGSRLNLSPHLRLGIGLFRLATGSPYREVSSRFRVSDAVSKFCTKQLCRVLCTNFRFWLAFPTHPELGSDYGSFPNCCGVIATAQFPCQKQSIAAQFVVDSSSKILSFVARPCGGKANFEILKSSALYKDVEGGNLLNSPPVYLRGVAVPQYLIGNGTFPLLPWLMVPFEDPVQDSCKEGFNVVHQLMCSPSFKAIASLKNWGILRQTIEEETSMAVACVGACAILHNVLLMREDYSAFSDGTDDYSCAYPSSHCYGDSGMVEASMEKKGLAIRGALAERLREFHGPTQLQVNLNTPALDQ